MSTAKKNNKKKGAKNEMGCSPEKDKDFSIGVVYKQMSEDAIKYFSTNQKKNSIIQDKSQNKLKP